MYKQRVTFYCWITLLTPAALDGLLAGLVRQGRGVEPLSSDGDVTSSAVDDMGCFVALQISTIVDDEDREHDEVLDEVEADLLTVIEERAIKHLGYALIVKGAPDGVLSTWASGNVKVPVLPTQAPTSAAWARLSKPG